MGQSVSVTPGAYHLAGGNPNFRKVLKFLRILNKEHFKEKFKFLKNFSR